MHCREYSCRLHEYREKVKERAKVVEAEEEKQRLRGRVLGKNVGPDVNAFLRQLGPDSKAVRCQPAPVLLTQLQLSLRSYVCSICQASCQLQWTKLQCVYLFEIVPNTVHFCRGSNPMRHNFGSRVELKALDCSKMSCVYVS